MRPQQRTGPRLPRKLLEQLGDSDTTKSKKRAEPSRKERRKADREQKKQLRKQVRPEPDEEEHSEQLGRGAKQLLPSQNQHDPRAQQKPLKSILKQTSSNKGRESWRASTNSDPPPRPSSQRERPKSEEDKHIAALEKKLGLKGKKRPKAFEDDGLDLLLDEGGGVNTTGEKRVRNGDDEWLARKRRKRTSQPVEEQPGSDDEEEGVLSDNMDLLLSSDEEERLEGDEYEQSWSNDELDENMLSDSSNIEEDPEHADMYQERSKEPVQPRVRENPYVAPVSADDQTTAKYVPPSLRAPPSSDTEALSRLKRQTQGLLNRLSEANLLSIVRDVERLYQNNAREYVTSTLVELLLSLLCDRSSLLDTFLILHAGFIAAVYKITGPEFGARMIESIVTRFDKHYSQRALSDTEGKETSNLVSLVAELYNLGVIGSNLMFDYVRFFLTELSELNTELLLRVIRHSGPQLRQDDPSSLKDIVGLLHRAIANTGEANLSVRTKFMVETINNLKNNRLKAGVNATSQIQEHTSRMKKALSTLKARSGIPSEPLRVGLQDIQNAEKKGKWWLVGASWRNSTDERPLRENGHEAPHDRALRVEEADIFEDGTADLAELAREQRMNTDVRRAIFVAIMSAADIKEAQLRLMKLKLKKAQEYEIPRVLLHCAGAEQVYNPYYTLIAQSLCAERKLRKAFQFNLWDLFRRFGEKTDIDDEHPDDDDEDEAEDMSMGKVVNLAQTFGTLIAYGRVPITALKPLNFVYLQAKTKVFVEVLLVTVILVTQKGQGKTDRETALLDVFMKVKDVPQMAPGLQYFLNEFVSRGGLTVDRSERKLVRRGCRMAGDGLTAVVTSIATQG